MTRAKLLRIHPDEMAVRGVPITSEIIARFESKIDTAGPTVRDELSPCWMWMGTRQRRGSGALSYGVFVVRKPVSILAHRFSMLLCDGGLAGGVVAHRCDNPACVRQDHLFAGTQAENLADMRAKGRAYFNRFKAGTSHPNAKITHEIAAEIRRLRGEGLSLARIGERVGLNASTVHDIVRGRTWRAA